MPECEGIEWAIAPLAIPPGWLKGYDDLSHKLGLRPKPEIVVITGNSAGIGRE